MSGGRKFISILVSSPSDVAEELEVCRRVIGDFAQDHLRTTSFDLLPFFWTTDTKPGVSSDAQALVTEQLASEPRDIVARIVVCILWTRIGSHTLSAVSGTAEEVVRALLEAGTGKTRLLVFKVDKPVAPSKVDDQQLAGLRRFFKSFELAGGLYATVDSVTEFESRLRKHLRNEIDDCHENLVSHENSNTPAVSSRYFSNNIKTYSNNLADRLHALLNQVEANKSYCLQLLDIFRRLAPSLAENSDGIGNIDSILAWLDRELRSLSSYRTIDDVRGDLRAARTIVAFSSLLSTDFESSASRIRACSLELVSGTRQLCEVTVEITNLVALHWPAQIQRSFQDSVVDGIRQDAATLCEHESDVQALERAIKLTGP